MRPIASCASSTAETCLAASALDNSTAVLKLHCDLAKAFLPASFLILPDDAQFRRGPQVGFPFGFGGLLRERQLSRQHPLHDAVAVDENRSEEHTSELQSR